MRGQTCRKLFKYKMISIVSDKGHYVSGGLAQIFRNVCINSAWMSAQKTLCNESRIVVQGRLGENLTGKRLRNREERAVCENTARSSSCAIGVTGPAERAPAPFQYLAKATALALLP